MNNRAFVHPFGLISAFWASKQARHRLCNVGEMSNGWMKSAVGLRASHTIFAHEVYTMGDQTGESATAVPCRPGPDCLLEHNVLAI